MDAEVLIVLLHRLVVRLRCVRSELSEERSHVLLGRKTCCDIEQSGIVKTHSWRGGREDPEAILRSLR